MLGVPGLSRQAHKQGVPVTVVVCTTALSPNLTQQLAIKNIARFHHLHPGGTGRVVFLSPFV